MSTLDVLLFAGNSRLRNVPVYIEVSSAAGGPVKSGYTDNDGRVSFQVPSGARYRINASGPGIENRSITFDVPVGARFHSEELQVELYKGQTAKAGKGGTVSAATLRVPEKAGHEFAKGMKEMNAHNWAKAREHFEKAIKDYPQFDWAYNNIGVADIQENNLKGAREAFEKAVAINDKNPDAVKNLARMKLNDNDYAGGKTLLLKLPSATQDPEMLTMLAFAQLKTNELDAALANAMKVHQGDPDKFPIAHLIAARVCEIKGNNGTARTQYQLYIKEAPDTPQAQVAREGLQRLDSIALH